MTEYIQINPADNVAVALHSLSKGTVIEVNGNSIELMEDIPAGHKIALKNFTKGDMVIKLRFPHIAYCKGSQERTSAERENCQDEPFRSEYLYLRTEVRETDFRDREPYIQRIFTRQRRSWHT